MIWPQLIASYPPFARYQRRTKRTIPVIELSRVDAGSRTPVEYGRTVASPPVKLGDSPSGTGRS